MTEKHNNTKKWNKRAVMMTFMRGDPYGCHDHTRKQWCHLHNLPLELL